MAASGQRRITHWRDRQPGWRSPRRGGCADHHETKKYGLRMRRGSPMSRHETPMTEGFWKSSAHGLFIAEYPLVQRGADRAPRYVARRTSRSWQMARLRFALWQTSNCYSNKDWPYGHVLDGPSALFRTLGARMRGSVGSINFVVPSVGRCIAPAFKAVFRSRGLAFRSDECAPLQTD